MIYMEIEIETDKLDKKYGSHQLKKTFKEKTVKDRVQCNETRKSLEEMIDWIITSSK